jgi:hypothetical protein
VTSESHKIFTYDKICTSKLGGVEDLKISHLMHFELAN